MNSLPRGIRLAAIVVATQGLVGPALAADSWWDSAINALMAARSGQTLHSDPVPARGAVDEWGSANAASDKASDKASERRQDERLRDDRVGGARPVHSGSSVSRTAAASTMTAAEPATRGAVGGPHRVAAESAPGCVNVKRVWSGAAALAATAASEADLAQEEQCFRQLDEVIAQRTVGANEDFDFHLAVARASGNQFFVTAIASMQAQVLVSMDF